METKIDLREYKEHFPESGSTRINHCKEGNSNRKFYLTRRDEDGIILGYCHHCGGSGSYRLVGERKVRGSAKHETSFQTAIRPNGASGDDSFAKWRVPQLEDWNSSDRWEEPSFSDLPSRVKRWWFSNHCLIKEYNSIGIKMLDGKALAIPLFLGTRYEMTREPTGLALRPLQDDLPKWILLGSRNQTPMGQWVSKKCAKIDTPLLVLTEDYISALRCSRFSCAMPLMGVNLSDWHLNQVIQWRTAALKEYEECLVMVWLDNDSHLVKQKARKIHQRLTNLFPTVILKGDREAKHFVNDSELEDYLWKQK